MVCPHQQAILQFYRMAPVLKRGPFAFGMPGTVSEAAYNPNGSFEPERRGI
jgi:hypothetical protein